MNPDQAGAVPFRIDNNRIEFCLITSTKRGVWGFPKGNIEPGTTCVQAALQEAYEEAGVRGRILGEPLGCYALKKKRGSRVSVTMYLMQADQVVDDWPESRLRQRCWVSAPRAFELLKRPTMRDLLGRALDQVPELL